MANAFTFKYLGSHSYSRDGKDRAIIRAYCNFGFVVKLYTSLDKLNEIEDFIGNTQDIDISDFVSVSYNESTNEFRYYIKK